MRLLEGVTPPPVIYHIKTYPGSITFLGIIYVWNPTPSIVPGGCGLYLVTHGANGNLNYPRTRHRAMFSVFYITIYLLYILGC